MGMGEPAHNLDDVLEAIDLLGTDGGIGHKNLVFSTVGDRRVFERLPRGPVKPALALSLHTTDPALRARLLPRAPRIEPDELVAARRRATRVPPAIRSSTSGRCSKASTTATTRSTASSRLLAGKLRGDEPDPVQRRRRPGLRAAGRGARRAPWRATLHRRGVLTKLRQSAGQDVDAGCGQLRARHERTGLRRIDIAVAPAAGTA